MRKMIVLLVVVVAVIMSCSMDIIEGFTFDQKHFNNFHECTKWIHENIEYKATEGCTNPDITLRRGYGDCNDMAVLLMAIMAYQHGIRDSYYIGINSNHAIVEYNGKYYDCTAGTKRNGFDGNQTHKTDFYHAMEKAYSDYQ